MNDEKSLAVKQDAGIIENVVINGDLSKLTPTQRVGYYRAVCNSLGLNPYTKPFDYISLNGKLVLYARKDATDQLRKIQRVSVVPTKKELNTDLGIYLVEVKATTPDGREDFATGAVSIKNLQGDQLANAMMKAETKAKRRAALSICGLGWMDETETESVREARPVTVSDAGDIIEGQVVTTTTNTEEVTPANGNGKAQEQPARPGVEHPGKKVITAKIGANQYPAQWARLLAAYKRASQNEVDAILQGLNLPQDTAPEKVVDAINAHIDTAQTPA